MPTTVPLCTKFLHLAWRLSNEWAKDLACPIVVVLSINPAPWCRRNNTHTPLPLALTSGIGWCWNHCFFLVWNNGLLDKVCSSWDWLGGIKGRRRILDERHTKAFGNIVISLDERDAQTKVVSILHGTSQYADSRNVLICRAVVYGWWNHSANQFERLL